MFFILSVQPGLGATIHLKDGGVEESDKVWEEDGYIHFILSGTKRVEIRYAREIVDRIEGSPFSLQNSANASTSEKAEGEEADRVKPRSNNYNSEPPEKHSTRYKQQLNPLVGIGFYDPRRSTPYWVNTTSHHHTIKSAISALAKQYNRPSAWVIANMGKANDLGVIHKNLVESLKKSAALPLDGTKTITPHCDTTAGNRQIKPSPIDYQPKKSEIHTIDDPDNIKSIPFYDPRRPLKYWSDEKTGHATISEAINAIGRKYGRRPAWVEENMGRINDLERIHRNLRESLQR